MNTERYIKAFDIANKAEVLYNSGYFSIADKREVKYMLRSVQKVCRSIEKETRRKEKEIWEYINLPDVGKLVNTYFTCSPFCVDEKNYNRFQSLEGSITDLLRYNELTTENKAVLNEINTLNGNMYSIKEEVSANEQKLMRYMELDVPLYEIYREKIIFSGKNVASVVIEFLGMSFFTDKADIYNEMKERYDKLLGYN